MGFFIGVPCVLLHVLILHLSVLKTPKTISTAIVLQAKQIRFSVLFTCCWDMAREMSKAGTAVHLVPLF